MVHDEVNGLYSVEYKRQRRHIEESASFEQTQAQTIDSKGGEEVDETLSEREQVVRHEYSHQRRREQE